VDADLRKGCVHKYFNTPAEPGFSEVLERQLNWKEAILATPQENLSFLPRGHTLINASEFFLGKVTDDFLREVYTEFDYVIIDSAPVLAKEDTGSLAPKADATLFVIRAGVASLRTSRSALTALHRRNVNVLGLVLNSTKKTGADSYYYQYGEYYEPQSKA
jgi:Mrp family chromosome partitioning ATPase